MKTFDLRRADGRPRRLAVLVGCSLALAVSATASAESPAEWPASFGFGRDASEPEITAWDRDVRPDGQGLPAGSGSVNEGEPVYAAKCAVCHGKTGVEGPNDRLVRRPGEGFPAGDDPDSWTGRTIGNYWPYATTVFDYILRSMPQNLPGSLDADEVYALTAYLLWRNDIVPAGTRLDAATLPAVKMPARDQFHPDDRLAYKEVR